MAYKLGSDIWSTYYLQGRQAELLTSQIAAIKIAEVELYGSEEARLAIENGTISDAL